MSDLDLAAAVAEMFDQAVEEVEEDVRRMEDCVRNHGLTDNQRKDTANHQIIFGVETEARYDNGTYYSVYNPFDVRSTSNRFEMSVHENAHHAYHAKKKASSAHHPRDYWENYRDPIRSAAGRSCRGGG